MWNDLNLIQFNPDFSFSESLYPGCFVVKTCQRTLAISFEKMQVPKDGLVLRDQEAYSFLLEVICGLKSKLLGETEIVSQFKNAFHEYSSNQLRDRRLIRLLNKIFQDAKTIRTMYLLGLRQKSYAAMVNHYLIQADAKEVVILGSGLLAQNLIRQLHKKFRISLCARNENVTLALSEKYSLSVHPWTKLSESHQKRFLINCIGTKECLLDETFFDTWTACQGHKGLFIDLGSPSPIQTKLTDKDGVIRLSHLFQESESLEMKLQLQVQEARLGIAAIIRKRCTLNQRNAQFNLSSKQFSFN
jgi:glutamyl-tRNA reductase